MYRIGIDLGGTFIKAGITNENHDILFKGEYPTGLPCSCETVSDNCATLVKKLLADAKLSLSDIKWVGMGAPGTVDCGKGIIEYANNLRFHKAPMGELIKARLGKSVYVGNDANVAAYGEYIKSGRDYKSFVFITLGTGLGGGVVIDGKIYTGFNYAGAELGHIVIEKDGVECTCGRRGCWEAYSSVTGLIRMTREEMEKDAFSALWRMTDGNADNLDGKIIFGAVREGDRAAKVVLDKYIDYLACGTASVINVFQPEVFCVGGGISAEEEYLIKPLIKRVENETYGAGEGKKTEIRSAKLLNNAGIIGAAALGEIYG